MEGKCCNGEGLGLSIVPREGEPREGELREDELSEEVGGAGNGCGMAGNGCGASSCVVTGRIAGLAPPCREEGLEVELLWTFGERLSGGCCTSSLLNKNCKSDVSCCLGAVSQLFRGEGLSGAAA